MQKGEEMIEETKMTFPLYVILSHNSHHFWLRPFWLTASSAALAVITICRESGPMCFSFNIGGNTL
jgi:hypothetical protein